MGAGEDLLPRRQDAYIRSRNHSGAFVLIDLMAIRLQMGGYCLRNAAAASSALISWAVEGSENGDEFETLDTRENCAALKAPDATAYFALPQRAAHSHVLTNFWKGCEATQLWRSALEHRVPRVEHFHGGASTLRHGLGLSAIACAKGTSSSRGHGEPSARM